MVNFKKKSTRVFLSSLICLLAGLIFFYFKAQTSIQIIKPRIGTVVEAVYGLGTVIAPQTYQVKTAINQSVSDVYVKEGDQVKMGAPLIKFDDSGLNRAPFSGTITSVPLRKGELLFPSIPALTLVNLKDLFLEVSLEQQAALRVRPQQKVIVSFESIRGDRMISQVQSIYPRDNQFIVRIEIKEAPSGILPGMTADVAIEVGRKEKVLSIPLRAISSGKVAFKRHGKTFKESVQVGITDGEWAEIISENITAEDQIMLRSK